MTGTLLPSPRAAATSVLAGATAVGDAPALVVGDRAVTHAQLRELVDRAAARLPDAADGRCLVQVFPRPDLDALVAYLATLHAGHVALVAAPGPAAAPILTRYRPDLAFLGDTVEVLGEEPWTGPRHLLHPDLALLLSTSGSTGSPKLVRLSHDNLRANADAIAQALSLTAADRAITSLPLTYCYGLSVLHSHLRAGASVVLHDGSVHEPGFWDAVDRHGVTTLAVVPHSARLALAGGLADPHPSLRLVTQAGGRLEPGAVLDLADLGARRGWDLAVMYGQTEATARIAVLPPAEVATAPDAVGRAVPGTDVRLDRSVPQATGGVGELVVTGPGVMLGYAEHPDDLAVGRMQHELRTGDLATVDADGLVRIVGRRSGFVKVMGHRIDVAQVENALQATGFETCVTGGDAQLRVLVEPPTVGGDRSSAARGRHDAAATARRLRALVAELTGLGPAAVAVAVAPLARRDNGKVDRPGCDTLVRAALETEGADPASERPGDGPPLEVQVAGTVARVLGLDPESVDTARSFVELGGDSLSHVQAATRLAGLLGELPRNWHHRPLRDLTAGGGEQGRTPLETSVVLRAVAALIILGTHADLFWIVGGAHVLLVVAGYNAGRFSLSRVDPVRRALASARTGLGILVPAAVVALVGLVTTGRYGWANVGAVNWIAGDVTYGSRNELWFVDALLASVAIMVAALSLPPVSRAYARDPWRVSIAVAAIALVPRFVILAVADGTIRGIAPTVFWLFATGVALAHAGTARRRRITLALATIGIVTFFDDPIRNATVLAGIVLLALVPAVRLPRRLASVAGTVGAASLYLYLVQFQVFDLVPDVGGRLPSAALRVAAALVVGCLVWRLADPLVRRLQQLIPLPVERNHRASSHPPVRPAGRGRHLPPAGSLRG
ncbi:AMP-binding protein [Barrientosiimonas humi]|uniref:AMP-binding protein n=1 Tax=Barrientosiimonas humi TaxID=999931 RepID=UPI00370D2F66